MKIIKPTNLDSTNAEQLFLISDGSSVLQMLVSNLSRPWLEIPDSFFEKSKDIVLKVVYEDGSEKQFSKSNKKQWIWSKNQCNTQNSLFRKNSNTSYSDNRADKNIIQELLTTKYQETLEKDSSPKGEKNLIYYTAGGNKEYLLLIQKSINSIWSLSQRRAFEFLFICPESWAEKIESFKPDGCIFNYHLVEDCCDGVEISKNKTRIFNFTRIDEYKKILYLDSDIIAVRNIDHIFAKNYDSNLYVACNVKSVSFSSHAGNYHGLKYFATEEIAELASSNQRPFNAGQFLFINSDAMKKHFENVNWLMSVWPGEYFFEQSFMNHYFCGFSLTENQSFGKKIKILSTVEQDDFNPDYDHDDILVHFIAPALNPTAKINYIEDYLNARLPQP
jgi:hypothetical protein